MEIGNRVKRVRKKFELTQASFGEKIGLKPTAVGQMESGLRNVTDRSITLICEKFSVNEDWLRNGGNDEDMFVEYPKDVDLAKYTQMLLMDEDDLVSGIIKNFIIAYEKLDNASKKTLQNIAAELLENSAKSKK